MSERCDRCGSVGEDRRTLWMACFYQMGELGLPFKQYAINGRMREQVGEEPLVFFKASAPIWGEPVGDVRDHAFFTLRVCKRCRGEWMASLNAWFAATPTGEDHDADERDPDAGCGSGIFVRVNGAIREITREEWDQTYPGREPVVYRPGDTGSAASGDGPR